MKTNKTKAAAMVDANVDADGPVQAKVMVNKFSKNILRQIVGNERAQNAFQSISMGTIPKSTSF